MVRQRVESVCPPDVADCDGDGLPSPEHGGTDCDDNDANRFPGNVEICDPEDHDEDCDPVTFGERDQDRDGYIDARCQNVEGSYVYAGDDCNDADAEVHPTAVEACDLIDNNCDGEVDSGVQVVGFLDSDGDGFGTGTEGEKMCAFQLFQPQLSPPRRFALYNTDCNDKDARMNPGAPEVEDDLDNDCNGVVDDVERE